MGEFTSIVPIMPIAIGIIDEEKNDPMDFDFDCIEKQCEKIIIIFILERITDDMFFRPHDKTSTKKWQSIDNLPIDENKFIQPVFVTPDCKRILAYLLIESAILAHKVGVILSDDPILWLENSTIFETAPMRNSVIFPEGNIIQMMNYVHRNKFWIEYNSKLIDRQDINKLIESRTCTRTSASIDKVSQLFLNFVAIIAYEVIGSMHDAEQFVLDSKILLKIITDLNISNHNNHVDNILKNAIIRLNIKNNILFPLISDMCEFSN